MRPALLCLMLIVSTVVMALQTLGGTEDSKKKAELRTKRDPARERARLERLVRHEVVMLPYYSVFDNLAFKVDGNRVELMGQVSRPTLKSDAERVVKNIEGVEGVTNNIEVLPVSSNDGRIRQATYRAIYSHPALQRYGLQAVVPTKNLLHAWFLS